MPLFHIRPAQPNDLAELTHFRTLLWPSASREEHAAELEQTLAGKPPVTLPLVNFVAVAEDGALAGFVEVDLRSHADGCNPTRPVGYIEGWYVSEAFRQQGVGKQLIAAAEDWARSHGCTEVASDTWIDNEISQHAHEALGYEIVDRCVHYRKNL